MLRNDSHLRDLNLWYRGWVRQRGIEHLILYETKTSSLFGMIVKPDSSDPGLSANPVPIDADHITIAKPPNRANQIYALIRDFIERRAERTVTREEIRIDAVKDDTLAIRDQQRQDSQKLSKLLAAVNWLRENSWNWLRANIFKAIILTAFTASVIAYLRGVFDDVLHESLPSGAEISCVGREWLIEHNPLRSQQPTKDVFRIPSATA